MFTIPESDLIKASKSVVVLSKTPPWCRKWNTRNVRDVAWEDRFSVLTVRLETEASMCGAGALVQDSNIAMSAALSIKLYKIF